MVLYTRKRTLMSAIGMSAKGHKRTLEQTDLEVFDASCGSFNPRVDFAAKHPKIDRFGEKRFGATIQGLALGLYVAVGGDHDNRDLRSKRFGLGQQFKAAHSRHVDNQTKLESAKRQTRF
jgi:hypothetical protein